MAVGIKKAKIVYTCTNCSHVEPKWLGRCPECGEWNSFREGIAENTSTRSGDSKQAAFSIPLESIDTTSGIRIKSGFSELDRVLGGGILRGSSVLVGGEPGIGKSTLLLQIASCAEISGRILYVSGEESAANIRLRADRLGLTKKKKADIEVLCTNDLEEILAALNRLKPVLFIVDSLQTMASMEAGTVPGTSNQVKYCSLELSDWARDNNSAGFLVAHVTKDGLIAGPKAAEHTVDVVLHFEQSESDIRFLRSTKNRFGSTDEVGFFVMSEKGLSELLDPSSVFLVRRDGVPPSGTAVAATWEGTRSILVEIQALTVPGKASISRVYSERIEPARVARVAAVLEKHVGISFSDNDIYVNVAGGIKLSEPGIDLALAMAIYSARTGLCLPQSTALAGELSLSGELRPVRRMSGRISSSKAMGFSSFIGSRDDTDSKETYKSINTINEAIKLIFGKK